DRRAAASLRLGNPSPSPSLCARRRTPACGTCAYGCRGQRTPAQPCLCTSIACDRQRTGALAPDAAGVGPAGGVLPHLAAQPLARECAGPRRASVTFRLL